MRLKIREWIGLIILTTASALTNAQALSGPPLRVAVSHFLPPYVSQSASKDLTGFDIIFMNKICELIHRRCVYITMETNRVLPAIAAGKADLGIGTLKITLSGYKMVNFSIPYMLSQSRFIGSKKLANVPFNLHAFNGKKIGVGEGGLFGTQVRAMKNFKPKIVKFKYNADMIEALSSGAIDIAIVDNPTAIYWQNHSSGEIIALGKPFNYGFGLGIAVNQAYPELIPKINQAIETYQTTSAFKQLYQMYFSGS